MAAKDRRAFFGRKPQNMGAAVRTNEVGRMLLRIFITEREQVMAGLMKSQKDFAGTDTNPLPIGKFDHERVSHSSLMPPCLSPPQKTWLLGLKARQSSLGADLRGNQTWSDFHSLDQGQSSADSSANQIPEPIRKDPGPSGQVKTVWRGDMGYRGS